MKIPTQTRRAPAWAVLGLIGVIVLLPAQGGRAEPSPHGTIVFDSFHGVGGADIWSVRPDGSGLRRLTADPADDVGPAWSPDGSRIAFASTRSGSEDVFLMDPDGSGEVNLTEHPARDFYPTWSPDGMRIAFVSDRAGSLDIWRMDADGTDAVRLTTGPGTESEPTWSADGGSIAFTADRDGIWVTAPDGTDQHRVAFGFTPAYSPVGPAIAWTDRGLILVRERGGPPFHRVADPSGLAWPTWSPDGGELAYQESGAILRVPAAGGPPILVLDDAQVVFRADW